MLAGMTTSRWWGHVSGCARAAKRGRIGNRPLPSPSPHRAVAQREPTVQQPNPDASRAKRAPLPLRECEARDDAPYSRRPPARRQSDPNEQASGGGDDDNASSRMRSGGGTTDGGGEGHHRWSDDNAEEGGHIIAGTMTTRGRLSYRHRPSLTSAIVAAVNEWDMWWGLMAKRGGTNLIIS